jgi:aldehyde:ferredoxin oxidoreductase
MIRGWTGKRLRIDLGLQKAWSEEIAQEDLKHWFGGRGLNASFFSRHFQSQVSPSSPENPLAFAAGPLTGTLAPCSGWTSLASFSPLSEASGYGFTRMPGHFGARMKGAGFDHCVLQGKAGQPVYLVIENGEVTFKKAGHLWGKETAETTVAIQEEQGDRDLEVLCIGPAGERQIPFANVIHRLSWTGDRLGLGYLFGVKHLKAIAVRGKNPVTLHDPRLFLNLCLTLKDRIQKDRKMQRLKEEGSFSPVGHDGGIMMKNGRGWLPSGPEKQWASSLGTHFSGAEGCFSCPVHCGRIARSQESYFAGVHLEKAWHLGPLIGVYEPEWTLKIHRLCQDQGLDPYAAGSFLTRVMDQGEDNPLSKEDQEKSGEIQGRGEKAFFILQRMLGGMLQGSREGFYPAPPPIPENEDLNVLADIISFCPVVVNRLNLMTVANIVDLIYAATAHTLSQGELRDTVWNILRMESRLQNRDSSEKGRSFRPLPGEGRIDKILKREERSNESVGHWASS